MKRTLITSAAAFALMTGAAFAQADQVPPVAPGGPQQAASAQLSDEMQLGINEHVRDTGNEPMITEDQNWEVGAALPADITPEPLTGVAGAENYRYVTSAERIYVVDENNNIVSVMDRM